MANGSIAVKPGQQVKAGTPIGKVGLSGNTEYPHLHFMVRKDGAVVEPFCGVGRSLWASLAELGNAYRAGEVLVAGFATGPVSLAEVLAVGADQMPRPSRDAPALAELGPSGLWPGRSPNRSDHPFVPISAELLRLCAPGSPSG
jgi:murein DD-endopeptidase MepM/ murein hydrolase activator NlpD